MKKKATLALGAGGVFSDLCLNKIKRWLLIYKDLKEDHPEPLRSILEDFSYLAFFNQQQVVGM